MQPVLMDLETRSACDLKAAGGYVYAADPSTRILTAAWTEDLGESYHVWCPGADAAPDVTDADTTWHVGPACPLSHLTDRVWVAHNAWTFDREVWRLQPGLPQPRKWGDTYPLALQQGLPGQLDQIGVRLWGEGKMQEGKSALLKWTRAKNAADADPRNVPPGLTWLIARYNVQDVRLLTHLWHELADNSRHQPAAEHRVLAAHDAVNDRGVRVDLDLVRAVRDLSRESVAHAVAEIAELTNGALPDLHSLRQRTRVLDWLERHGVRLVADQKRTLRRDAVDKWLAAFEGEETDDDGDPDAGVAFDPESLKLAARVLRLRNAAMRITEGKLDAALQRASGGRVRGLFAYWSAHTGRWAGRGIQVQNLPRPKKGVPVWDLVRLYESTGTLPYAEVQSRLSNGATADDAASALIRCIFVPDEGQVLLAADLASIESRVLAWLAGEEQLLAAFRSFGCPYSLMAAKLFGREVTSKKDPIRQVGKVVVLGCLAEGTPVLTERGWVAIESVTLTDRVWDGEAWVTHGGVVNKGRKRVLCGGLNLTPDHLVLCYSASGEPVYNPHEPITLEPGEPTEWRRADAVWGEAWRPTLLRTTYDIVNAGPNHRFQAGPLIVHNCGYSLGDEKFALYGAANGIDFAEQGITPYECVDGFRTAFPAIAGTVQGEIEGRKWRRGGFWSDLNETALAAVRSPGREMGVGRIGFESYAGHLYVTLPSGRHLCYRSAREVESTTWWGKQVQTVEYQSPRFKATKLYGGKWAENIVQAVSRDFLAEALVRLKGTTVLHVHDEIVATGRPEDLPGFMKAFTSSPSWASDLPLDAEGGIMPRYAKEPPSDWPKEQLWRNGERVT